MAAHCIVTGKRPVTGNRVSHANNRTRRRFKPNLQTKRFFVPSLGRTLRLTVSAKGLRIINKRGIEAVVTDLLAAGHRL